MLLILFIISIIVFCVYLFLYLFQTENNIKVTAAIDPGTYLVTWYKQAGGIIRTKNLTAQQLIDQVHLTFSKAQSRINFEELTDGYKFSRTNWRHSRSAEGQRFGYIIAKKIN
jgi:hypothetical protein